MPMSLLRSAGGAQLAQKPLKAGQIAPFEMKLVESVAIATDLGAFFNLHEQLRQSSDK